MTIPKITYPHIARAIAALGESLSYVEICNKAIEIALAEQQESEYITAKQARERVIAGDEIECFWPELKNDSWDICVVGQDYPNDFIYRAIKQAQPEPSDPHAKLRAEYAKQVKEGTVEFYLWEYKLLISDGWEDLHKPSFFPEYEYRCTDISCIVAKQGEPAKRMLRTEAQELQRSLGDKVEWSWVSSSECTGKSFACDLKPLTFINGGTYTYEPKALKKISWSDMPVGVAVFYGGEKMTTIGFKSNILIVFSKSGLAYHLPTNREIGIELAPASEQPWIPTIAPHEGLVVEYSKFSECMKITGIAEGYVLEGAV